jgi:epoxyqueuosine reductase
LQSWGQRHFWLAGQSIETRVLAQRNLRNCQMRFDDNYITHSAKVLGLEYFGAASLPSANQPRENARFLTWLAAEKHAGMAFLEKHVHIRTDPNELLPHSSYILTFGLPYYNPADKNGQSRAAMYATLRDYHKVIRKKLEKLSMAFPASAKMRICVDSAPILERFLATESGRAFIGKNTCVIHKEYGSYFLLGEILIAGTELAVDTGRTAAKSECGSCRRCQVHCPTGALSVDYQLDARLCLAYWTIEHRGIIPLRFWHWLGEYYFGCDKCQTCCPFNRRAPIAADPTLRALAIPTDLAQVARMDHAEYERYFGGTPMTRAKREGLQRNALIALTVTGDSRIESLAADLLARSDTQQVVRDTIKQIEDWHSTPAETRHQWRMPAGKTAKLAKSASKDSLPEE